MKKRNTYILSFIFGFLSCWFLFRSSYFSNLYKNIFLTLGYRGILNTIFAVLLLVFWFVLNSILQNFIQKMTKIRIISFAIISLIYLFIFRILNRENYISNWKDFTIFCLNFLLYIFAWYSLAKAFKVWRKYGNFYTLLLAGKIKKYLLLIIIFVLFVNILLFVNDTKNFTKASGLLFLSLLILFILCYIFCLISVKSKFFLERIKIWQSETQNRISNGEKPKEVSVAYDQMTMISLTSVICKRVLDITKETDFQFIISKVFKIVCYSVSLITTCKFTKQIKTMSKSLLTVGFVLSIILAFAYSSNFHYFLVANPHVDKFLCNIIDYIFLPFGTIKVIIQIVTVLIVKKTAGISVNYFIVGGFFSTITAFNLITKGNYNDNTITMSLYKGLLYLTMAIITIIIEHLIEKKVNKTTK